MLQGIRSAKYLSMVRNPLDLVRTKKLLQVNPTISPLRKEPDQIKIFVFDYDSNDVEIHEVKDLVDCYKYLDSAKVSWINVDGLKKTEVEEICNHFGIHPLITEDILSYGQRPKMDELNGLF